MLLALWISLAPSLADDASWLAPGLSELRTERARLQERVERAEALATAAGRMQNIWAEAAIASKLPSCETSEGAQRAALASGLGAAWRDAAQDARVQADRVRELVERPTVAPLLPQAEAEALLALAVRAEAQPGAYLEHLGWYRAYGGSAWAGCPAPLGPSTGLVGAPAGPRTAIFGIGGGFVCPGGAPANGRAVVVTGGAACIDATEACGCTPEPVLPGAVLSRKAE